MARERPAGRGCISHRLQDNGDEGARVMYAESGMPVDPLALTTSRSKRATARGPQLEGETRRGRRRQALPPTTTDCTSMTGEDREEDDVDDAEDRRSAPA